MPEIEPIQSSEELENEAQVDAARELDEVTHEPGARVEKNGSVEQAEVIETAFTELVGTDRKVSQTDPPETVKEGVKPAKKETGEGEAVTPINLPSPEKMRGIAGDKAEPDPEGSQVKVVDDPKSKSVKQAEDESETPDSHEATPITLPDKQSLQATPITLPSQESQPDSLAQAELPEQARMGVEKESGIEEGLKGLGIKIPGVGGLLEDDPFSQGGMGPNLGGNSSEIDNIMPDFQEAIEAAQMEREPFDPGKIGGGPGSVHPNYGVSGRSMVSEDDDSSKDKEEVVDHKKKMQEVYKAEMKLFEAINERDEAEKEYKENPSDETGAALDTAEVNYWDAVNHYNFLVSKKAEYKGEVRMPRPDGDEGEVEEPKSEEDIKFSNEAIDPSQMHGGPHSSGIDHRKHQGVVSDPAEWQDAGKPDSGIKVDRSINVDPSGDELGKEAETNDD